MQVIFLELNLTAQVFYRKIEEKNVLARAYKKFQLDHHA